jgi:Tol biopolymer transport system component
MRFLMKAKRLALAMTVGAVLIAVPDLCASLVQSASARNPILPLPAGRNGNSVAPRISADGRFVLFSSSANDLVPDDNNQLGVDVYLRDRASNNTVLVSANFSGTGGGNGDSLPGQLSADGRYTVFQSDASDLLPGDTNGFSDIFVRDLQTGSNMLVSVAADGSWGNGASTDPVMTPDGRFVAFLSAATNLVAGDTNGIADAFVRDLVSGTTRLISAGASGVDVSAPVMTPDGRFVAYACPSAATVLSVTGEVYVCDLFSNVTIRASTNAANITKSVLNLSSAACYHAVISDDGQYVVFKAGTGTGLAMIFQYRATNGMVTAISSNGVTPWQQIGDIYGPEMSPDGRFVVFVATNSDLACRMIQLWDAQTGTNLNVSVALDGSFPTNSDSDSPSVTPDGRYVVFMSNATNLTANPVINGFHIYRRDVQAATTQLIDVDTNGAGSANLVMTIPVISSNGQFVAFDGFDGGLVNGDNNGASDVFVRDLNSDTTELVSTRANGLVPQTGDGLSSLAMPALSDDGQKLVFTSYADDLVPNDLNVASDVFAYDVATGTNALVSAGLDGNPAAGSSFNPALAPGGRFVAFVSTATNLVAGPESPFFNVFLRDLWAGTNSLVSVAPDGVTPGNGNSSYPAISEDGHYAVFLSFAANLAAGGSSSTSPNAYFRDLRAGTTTLLTSSALAGMTPGISADGRYVAYVGSSSQLIVRDTQAGTNVYGPATVASAALSPAGGRLLTLNSVTTVLSVIDLANKSNLMTVASKSRIQFSAPWSNDGRFVVFSTATNAVALDANGTNDIYLCDLQTRTLTLVSVNADYTGSGSHVSDSPTISSDGHFVIYRSFATNLVAGNVNPLPNIYLYDCFTGSNTLLTAVSPGSSWTSWNARPAINGDGSSFIFQSWNPNFAANDLNRVSDVFAQALPPWGTADSDGDGIPDLWMTHYFGHPTGEAGDLSLAQDDADGDGMSNQQEFLAGTAPTNPGSVLAVQITPLVVAGSTATLKWPAVPGRNYQAQYTDSLTGADWLNYPGGVTVLGGQASITVPATQAARFFRAVCVP